MSDSKNKVITESIGLLKEILSETDCRGKVRKYLDSLEIPDRFFACMFGELVKIFGTALFEPNPYYYYDAEEQEKFVEGGSANKKKRGYLMKEKTQLDQKQLTHFIQLNTNNHRASSGALFLYYPTEHHPPVLYLSLSTAFKIDSIAYSQPNFYIPQFVPLFPCSPSIFHHFSPLLSIHLFHCGKCGKTC